MSREALGHHMDACFSARFRQEGARHEASGAQDFITQAIKELQEAQAMRGERRRASPGAAAASNKASELRVCVNIPGLNKAASQERLWPSRVGQCEGPPHSYVRMPFGPPNVVVTFQ